MSHTIIDQLDFQALTGYELDDTQASRFDTIAEAVIAELEMLLGWPLDPDSWDNQYIEIGKSQIEGFCPDADSDAELDSPDAVVGSYRLYTFDQATDVYLPIDPATAIHAVKMVENNITCKTYEAREYLFKTMNGAPQIIKYIGIKKLMCISCARVKGPRTFAIDADWAYEELPADLKKVLADMIAYQMDEKSDVKSESVVSHSYSKFDRGTPLQIHARTLQRYAGPHGTATRRLN